MMASLRDNIIFVSYVSIYRKQTCTLTIGTDVNARGIPNVKVSGVGIEGLLEAHAPFLISCFYMPLGGQIIYFIRSW